MISDERLENLASGAAWTCIQDDEGCAMAKELLAMRKAFSEPVVWALDDELEKAMKVNGDGMMCGFGSVTKDWSAPNTIFLYRKPTDSTT